MLHLPPFLAITLPTVERTNSRPTNTFRRAHGASIYNSLKTLHPRKRSNAHTYESSERGGRSSLCRGWREAPSAVENSPKTHRERGIRKEFVLAKKKKTGGERPFPWRDKLGVYAGVSWHTAAWN